MIEVFNEKPGEDQGISVKPTSASSAILGPMDLNDSKPNIRLRFMPTIVDNPNDSNKSVKGSITYEKKKPSDTAFPLDNEESGSTRKSTQSGSALVLNLDSSETRALFDCLRRLYQMYDQIGIPKQPSRYLPVDQTVKQLYDLLKQDASAARMIAESETFELVKELLKLLTQGKTRDELIGVFHDLEINSLNNISESLSLEQLRRAESLIVENLKNNDEEFWQSEVFGSHPWILSHIFSAPCTVFEEKAYVGGKSIENVSGNIVDFVFQNSLTSNVALVEIKTPKTEILGGRYRNNSYSLSKDLSGAINQVLSYRQSLMNEYAALQANSTRQFNAFHPQCVVVAGNLEELEQDRTKVSTFENFRQNLNGVEVITYDELLQRIKNLIALLSSSGNNNLLEKSLSTESFTSVGCIYDEDIPF